MGFRINHMLPIGVLDAIPSFKIRYLINTYLEGIQAELGRYFFVYIKEFYMDEGEIDVLVGYTPKPDTIFMSVYADFTKLPQAGVSGKTVIRVSPRHNKNPYVINRYNLYKQLTPTNHKRNLSTEIERVKVTCRCLLDARYLKETNYGTVESTMPRTEVRCF